MTRQQMIWLTGLAFVFFSVELLQTIAPGVAGILGGALSSSPAIAFMAALPAVTAIGFLIAGVMLLRKGLETPPDKG